MDNDKTNVTYHGIGFVDVLCLIFITLKLTHVIDWSWWVVLAPIWMQIVILIILFVIILIYYLKEK